MWLFRGRWPDRPIRSEYWRAREWNRIKKQFGFPRELRFHDLRHSFATILLSRGAEQGDVQRLMRHRSISMTMDVYQRLQPRQLARELVFFNDIGGLENGIGFEVIK